jgi:hypothetical protein
MNRWIEQDLCHYVEQQQQGDWVQYLPLAEYTHNSWPHNITKLSPHQILLGFKPSIHVTPSEEGRSPAATERLIEMQQVWVHAAQALLRRYKTTEPKTQYQEGDQVWLDGQNLPLKTPSRKLAPKRYGPFTISQKVSSVAYRLELPEYMRVHNVFHIDLLSPYKEMEQYGPVFIPPPPDLIEGQEEQEIEAILDVRRKGRGHNHQYLIKWKGFPSSENEWVERDAMHADDLIKQFHTSRLTRDKRRMK